MSLLNEVLYSIFISSFTIVDYIVCLTLSNLNEHFLIEEGKNHLCFTYVFNLWKITCYRNSYELFS